jgi:hypothetical protein
LNCRSVAYRSKSNAEPKARNAATAPSAGANPMTNEPDQMRERKLARQGVTLFVILFIAFFIGMKIMGIKP